MKVKLSEPQPLDAEALKAVLEQEAPQYEYIIRSKKFLVAKKTNTAGANILPRKKAINVVGTFPSMGAMMVFTLSVVLLGILIPLIIFFVVFHKDQKAAEREIGDILQRRYG